MRRLWCAAAGVPVGALAALALAPGREQALALGALAGALLLPALVWIVGRGGREPALAAPAQAGWLALPAAVAAFLGLAPGALGLLVLVVGVLVAGLFLAGRTARSPAGAALAFLVGGFLGVPLLAGFLAARGAVQPSFGAGTAAAIYEVDARVTTRPLPVCGDGPARVETLLEQGAHPRLAEEGTQVWFDAPAGEDGRRQIHRLAVAGGDAVCITCGEAGNNRRPAPNPAGTAVVFDTDRHADRRAPFNTEIHHLRVVAGVATRLSRRLTVAPGRDDHAILDPGGRGVVWSHGGDGRFAVVSAGFRTGHGALLLGDPNPVLPGGAAWAAPVAWSSDARGLAWVRGNPLGLLSGHQLDPATARSDELGGGFTAGGVAYSADGGRVVVASSDGDAAGAGRLPAFLGFLLGNLPAALEPVAAAGPTRLRTGLARIAPLHDVDLGAAAAWGAPGGVALSPDGTWLVLAQRNPAGRERLLRVTLDCAIP